MSEIPSTFFSKKSLQSLPQLAFGTWIIVLIIDAIFIQHLEYNFTRVLVIWVIGLSISLLLELLRYKNLSGPEKSDYQKAFFLLNTFLIFLTASSYTGFTKQLGAWGELANTVNRQDTLATSKSHSAIFLAAIEWSIPFLAKQTSYFPDVTVIAENNQLKTQNAMLIDSLQLRKNSSDFPSDTNEVELKRKVDELSQQLAGAINNTNAYNDTLTKILRADSLLIQRVVEINLIISRISELNQDGCIQAFSKSMSIECKDQGKEYLSKIRELKPVDLNLK